MMHARIQPKPDASQEDLRTGGMTQRLELELELHWPPVQELAGAGLTLGQAQALVGAWLRHGMELAGIVAGLQLDSAAAGRLL
jgi:hypothetical protein